MTNIKTQISLLPALPSSTNAEDNAPCEETLLPDGIWVVAGDIVHIP